LNAVITHVNCYLAAPEVVVNGAFGTGLQPDRFRVFRGEDRVVRIGLTSSGESHGCRCGGYEAVRLRGCGCNDRGKRGSSCGKAQEQAACQLCPATGRPTGSRRGAAVRTADGATGAARVAA